MGDVGGPTPIFTAAEPDGVTRGGTLHPAVADALRIMLPGVRLARVALSRDLLFVSEHPAGHGMHSLLRSKKLEQHSTMHETTPFMELASEFGLLPVHTDQGASGHDHRKATEFLSCKRMYAALMPVLGVLRLPDDWVSAAPPMRGKDEQGKFRTKVAEVYPPLLCERLASGWVSARASTSVERGVDDTNAASACTTEAATDNAQTSNACTATSSAAHATGDVSGYAIGDRIEVYWTKMKKWFAGVIRRVSKSKASIKGTAFETTDIQVMYDDGHLLTHSTHNNMMRHEDPFNIPSIHMIRADRLGDHSYDDEALQDAAVEHGEDLTLEEDRLLILTDLNIELETGEALNKASLFLTQSDGQLQKAEFTNSMDTLNARYWHKPNNEREFQRSPQRALWQTAKELKWDEYLALNMFDWVPISQVDRKEHQIYNTLWVYGLKLNSDLTFRKLNPRWCLRRAARWTEASFRRTQKRFALPPFG